MCLNELKGNPLYYQKNDIEYVNLYKKYDGYFNVLNENFTTK